MSDRVILISGGSRGLGLELVSHFLAAGDRVATFSRSASEAMRQRSGEPANQGRFMHAALDATDSAAVVDFVKSVVQRFGRIDALVNNAAVARDGVLATTSDQAIRQVVEVNLVGALLLTREATRQMLLNGPSAQRPIVGRVVNVSSIIGQRGYAGLAAYAATKAALIGMTASLARELGPAGITVNAVAPGYLETEMTGQLSDAQKAQIVRRTPLGRLGRPGDVVGAVAFLLSPSADFITGQTLTIDGGISC